MLQLFFKSKSWPCQGVNGWEDVRSCRIWMTLHDWPDAALKFNSLSSYPSKLWNCPTILSLHKTFAGQKADMSNWLKLYSIEKTYYHNPKPILISKCSVCELVDSIHWVKCWPAVPSFVRVGHCLRELWPRAMSCQPTKQPSFCINDFHINHGRPTVRI